jgi:hypothetical protein
MEAVDKVQNLLDQLSVQNKEEEQQPATLERAQNVIQLVMERLEEDLCHLLTQNSRYVDPDWFFDYMAVAGSFRSSFNDDHHHTVDDAAAALKISSSEEEDAAGDEDEDVLPVARPREILPTTVDLISSRERERELSVIVCLGVSNSRVFFFVFLFSFCEKKTLAC